MTRISLLLAGCLIGLTGGCGEVPLTPVTEDPGLIGVSLGQVAVVTGDFDRVEELLTDLEIPFNLYDGFVLPPPADAELADAYSGSLPPVEQLFSDAELLQTYDVVFVNCGARGTGTVDPYTLQVEDALLQDPDILENIRDFVENGGALFLSDRSYTLLEAAFPELIDFYGDDATPGEAEAGAIATLTGSVVDAGLAEELSSGQVTLQFPVSGWVIPVSSEGVWIDGDAPLVSSPDGSTAVLGAPLLIHQNIGYGNITFTSFHNLPEVDETWMELEVQVLRSLAGAP